MRAEGQSTAELVERLGRWLEVQPEYPFLFLHDRKTRRRAARIVAYRLMVLPRVEPRRANFGTPDKPDLRPVNRADIRGAKRRQGRAIGQAVARLSAKRERALAKAERDRRRYARLSEERLKELVDREFSGEQYQYADENDPALD